MDKKDILKKKKIKNNKLQKIKTNKSDAIFRLSNLLSLTFLKNVAKKRLKFISFIVIILALIGIICGAVGGTIKNQKKNKPHHTIPIQPPFNTFYHFAPYANVSLLENSPSGHYKTLTDFKKLGVETMRTSFLIQDEKDRINPSSYWDGVTPTDGSDSKGAYINKQISDYQKQGGKIILAFGGETGTTNWAYGVERHESVNLIANDISTKMKKYNTTSIDFEISQKNAQEKWENEYLGKSLNLILNHSPYVNITLTFHVTNNGMYDYSMNAINTIKKEITNTEKIINLNIIPSSFQWTKVPNLESTNVEHSVSHSFQQYHTTYKNISSTELKKHFSVSPIIGTNSKHQTERFSLVVAKKVFSWAKKDHYANWGFQYATRDYPGDTGPNASGTTQKNGDFCKLFAKEFN